MLPTRCDDCILNVGVSISIKEVFDNSKIWFKLNDRNGILLPPFPVFELGRDSQRTGTWSGRRRLIWLVSGFKPDTGE